MGDGVLAYFGYPAAQEDDAERSIRAALSVVAAVVAISSPAGRLFRAGIGIATGQVIIGELIGEGVAREQAIAGETPNLAARLQGAAEPNTVFIAECPSSNGLGQSELFRDGGSGSFGFEIRRLSTDVAIVAV